MNKTRKLPIEIDLKTVKEDLARLVAEDWTPHFNTQYYEGDWSGAALRAAAGAHVPLYADPTAESYVDTELLTRCPAVTSVLTKFHCETETVRFLRLGPGAVIRDHRDYKLSLEDGLARVHIPIKTSSKVEFYLDGELLDMKEGEAWYLNFNLYHSVRNNGDEERVHLVIDCVVNDWFRQFFTTEA